MINGHEFYLHKRYSQDAIYSHCLLEIIIYSMLYLLHPCHYGACYYIYKYSNYIMPKILFCQ